MSAQQMPKYMLAKFEELGDRLGVEIEPYYRDGRFLLVVEAILDRLDELDERIKALEAKEAEQERTWMEGA